MRSGSRRRAPLSGPAVALAIAATLLVGCGDGDEERTENDMSTDDPMLPTDEDEAPADAVDEALAALSFASAEDDARHRCLLESLGAEAAAAELVETPSAEMSGELRKSWCSDRQADGSACERGALELLTEPDARALSVWARRADAAEAVDAYGYRAVRNPSGNGTAAEPSWSLHFERTFGEGDGFVARFVPYEEDGRDEAAPFSVFQRFGYRGADITVTYPDELLPTELLAALVESPGRLESVLVERYDTLLAEFERRVGEEEMDAAARESALADARDFLGTRRDLVTGNSARFHALLAEQVALDRCG